MITNRTSRGFTMAEVIVSVAVMAMLIGPLLEFVTFAGDVWTRTHAAVTLSAEADAVLDAIERELMVAKSIVLPLAGDSGTTLEYRKIVSDWQAAPAYDEGTMRIAFTAPKIQMTIAASPGTWAAESANGAFHSMPSSRYEYDIARHVTDFLVTRETAQLIHLYVKVANNPMDSHYQKTIEASRTIFLTTF